jgi:hypothetical protein
VLIRHARAADRDAEGRLRLCGQVDALYTSTLRRTLETAEQQPGATITVIRVPYHLEQPSR